MGKMVEAIAKERGHKIVSIVDKSNGDADLRGSDVCIDFSKPDALLGNVRKAGEYGANLVIGTTGWEEQFDEVKMLVDKYGIACVYAPNFSLGVYLFKQIVSYAAELMSRFPEYDIAGLETHHHEKVDSPSGTALMLAEEIMRKARHKSKLVTTLEGRPRLPHELHFPSLRVGHVPGTHEIVFDSESDTITLSHQARSRSGFALGAVIAAEKIMNFKGLHTFEELLKYEESLHI